MQSVISLFKDESAIFSLSSSGEGDWKGTWKRFQDTKNIIKSIDTNHVVVSEPIMHFDKKPSTYLDGFTSDIVGYRNYGLGTKINSDADMGMFVRLSQIIPNSYIAEGSYPSSNLYTWISQEGNSRNCWVGTDYYRRYLRDWIYFGFIAQMPVIVTWDEVFTEDERIVMNEVKNSIDWNKPIARPKVSILINDSLCGWDGRPYLAKYENVFSSLAIDYRFIEDKNQATPNEWFIDPLTRINQTEKELIKEIPVKVLNSIPFKLSQAYSAHFFQAEDKSYTVAYIYNTSNHEKMKFYLSGEFHRVPKPAILTINKLNFDTNFKYKLYDLNTKTLVYQGQIVPKLEIKTENNDHDYLLIIEKK